MEEQVELELALERPGLPLRGPPSVVRRRAHGHRVRGLVLLSLVLVLVDGGEEK